jgi:hypothetical protein
MKFPRTIAALALTGGLAAGVPAAADAGHGGGPGATYRVTIENTATGFQPLSPAGVVVHSRFADVWSLGAPASAALAAVAEDANVGVFVDTYSRVQGVGSSFQGGAGAVPPGGSTTFEFDASPGQRLSLVSMLVNTNDGFTGLDGVRLGGGTEVYEVDAYDAGTEANDEFAAHIPGPCCGNPFVRHPEGGVVAHHPGIAGVGDLAPGEYDWNGPVATITVERID